MTNETQANDMQRQVMGLSNLIHLENRSRQIDSVKEFGFFVTNESKRLLNYHQAVFCFTKSNRLTVSNISGVPNYENNAPFIKWLKKLIAKSINKKRQQQLIISEDDIPKALQKGWQEWAGHTSIWCPFIINKKLLGGLWLSRDDTWQEAELGLLQQLANSYAYSLYALTTKTKWWNPQIRIPFGKTFFQIIMLGSILAALFIPVQLSVLAPAKVTAINPLIVTSPLGGVIKTIHVTPNQHVSKGQLLATLDDTALKNRYNVAGKTLDVVKAEYKKSRQKSLLSADKGSDSDLLKAKIQTKEAELKFTKDELSRVNIKADRDGIALFNDPNEWLGKPVVIGEKIITLADPNQSELEIHIPVENAINLESGTKIRLFLNIDPNRTITAQIYRTSYEAEISEERILSFRVKASFAPGTDPVRIGSRGTAKIFGEKVPLYYYLFRRPLAKLRQALGI